MFRLNVAADDLSPLSCILSWSRHSLRMLLGRQILYPKGLAEFALMRKHCLARPGCCWRMRGIIIDRFSKACMRVARRYPIRP